MNGLTLKEILEKNSQLKRKHAPFYDSYNDEVTEGWVFSDFYSEFESSGEIIESYKNVERDPPDIEVKTRSGKTIAIEITEIVSEICIGLQIKRDAIFIELQSAEKKYQDNPDDTEARKRYFSLEEEYRETSQEYFHHFFSWDRNSFESVVKKRISRKSRKCSKLASRYDEVILLLHTDEHQLTTDRVTQYVKSFVWPRNSVFNRGYVIVAYDPAKRRNSVIELPIKKCCVAASEYVEKMRSTGNRLPRGKCFRGHASKG